MENQNGTFEMVENVDEGLIKSGMVTNVGSRFEHLSVCYLVQGVLSLVAATYQLFAIYFMSNLLAYSYWISRINKLFMIYGGYILAVTYMYRLDEAGKICSGDYLTEEMRDDPLVTKHYLIESGGLFWAYMCGIWVISILAVFCCATVGYQVYQTFI